MQVELGGGRGANKRNPLTGGGNFGSGDGAVPIQLPSLRNRARQPSPPESAMSSLGPTRPASAAMMRDAGRILSVDSFDDDNSFDEGDLVAGVVGGTSGRYPATGAGPADGGGRAAAGGGAGGRGEGQASAGGVAGGVGVVPGGGGDGPRGGGSGSNQVLVRRIDGGFDRDGAE